MDISAITTATAEFVVALRGRGLTCIRLAAAEALAGAVRIAPELTAVFATFAELIGRLALLAHTRRLRDHRRDGRRRG